MFRTRVERMLRRRGKLEDDPLPLAMSCVLERT
jgi:hypothetical protein